MQCPNADGELNVHTANGENNLTVSYSTCPACHGHWMEPFAANFIKLPPEDLQRDGVKPAHPPGANLICPICQKLLERTTGDNIPDTVWVYTCPEGHGYFFPAGELAAFKAAQKTKIEYHKLWNLPLPSVRSVLLAGFLFLVLAGGIVAGLLSIQNRQTATSQAHGLLTSQHAYVTPIIRNVLLSAQTDFETTVTVHIPDLNNMSKPLDSTDLLTHTITVSHVPPGSYTYYFTIQFSEEEVQTETFTFVMPL